MGRSGKSVDTRDAVYMPTLHQENRVTAGEPKCYLEGFDGPFVRADFRHRPVAGFHESTEVVFEIQGEQPIGNVGEIVRGRDGGRGRLKGGKYLRLRFLADAEVAQRSLV